MTKQNEAAKSEAMNKLNEHIDNRIEERGQELESRLMQKFTTSVHTGNKSEWEDYKVGEGRAFVTAVQAMHEQWEQTGSVRGFEGRIKDDGFQKRFLGTGTNQGGGNVIPTPLAEDIIPALWARMALSQAGARVIPMQSDTLNIGRQNSRSQAFFIGEGTAGTESGPTFNQLQLQVKKLMGLAEVSKDFLRTDARVGAEFVADDLIRAIAHKMEETILRGVASATVPGGIRGKVAAGNVFELTGAVSASDIEAKLDEVEKAILDGNVSPADIGVLMGDRDYLYLRRLREAGQLIYPELREGSPRLIGKPVYRTNMIAEDVEDAGGTLNDLSRIWMGDFSSILVGMLTDTEVSFSEHAEFASDLVLVKVVTHFDVQLRRDTDLAVLEANFSA